MTRVGISLIISSSFFHSKPFGAHYILNRILDKYIISTIMRWIPGFLKQKGNAGQDGEVSKEREGDVEPKEKIPVLALFLGTCASIGGFIFGYESGEISGMSTIPWSEDSQAIDSREVSWPKPTSWLGSPSMISSARSDRVPSLVSCPLEHCSVA